MSTTVIDLLDALRTHLNDFKLPSVCSVHLTTYAGGAQVSMQLATHHLPEIADGLLAWVDTLTHVTAEVWRVPRGDSLHLSVSGQLSEGIQVQVYGSLPFTEHGIGADLAPNGSKIVSWAVLRERATPGEVIL
ncbi:MAG: hypothetical protein JO309_02820 [Pseudonocardiales bacterium]|nr:hypothetical protein [Pseudonocardiales bacterium]MBV9728348.1 hypothetical protein [Pseudonocardiales bacterium]